MNEKFSKLLKMIDSYADNKVEIYSLKQLKKELNNHTSLTGSANLYNVGDKKIDVLEKENNDIVNEIFDFAITKKEQSLIKRRIKNAEQK